MIFCFYIFRFLFFFLHQRSNIFRDLFVSYYLFRTDLPFFSLRYLRAFSINLLLVPHVISETLTMTRTKRNR